MNRAEISITTESPDETRAIGQTIGRSLEAGACIALLGTLGAGKTEMVKGIAAGAEVDGDVVVNSPTYLIVNEYPGRVYLFHIDAYRLSGSEELHAAGFGEMCDGRGAVVIEWADRVEDALPADRLTVHIEHAGDQSRRIRIATSGPRSQRIADAVK
jgi:tRNA threonylcarbamoyladenosine biosynthesis protein TsaE